MRKPSLRLVLATSIATLAATAGPAAQWHVPADFAGIQLALNHCTNGDLILVDPGVYYENIDFRGKAVTLSSTNPLDLAVVSSTVIHGSGQGSVVTFAHAEGSNSMLTGFTITGGAGSTNSDFGTNVFWGAGIYCYHSSPTVSGNLITANTAPDDSSGHVGYGGGIGCVYSGAIVSRNRIYANTGSGGGGIMSFAGQPGIVNNLIFSNAASFGGGVALISGGQLLNNTVAGNSAQFAGNLYLSSDASGPCRVTDNIICTATNGGGIYLDSSGTYTPFTFNDVWGNTGENYYYGDDKTGVDGNISANPAFADEQDADYHLLDTSPCINAGTPSFPQAVGELDVYGGVRRFAGQIDIGACEYSDHFRPIADAGPDRRLTVTALPAWVNLDGSASTDPNGAALSYHWREVSGPAGLFQNPEVAQPTFQATALGSYVFELAVHNGAYTSFVDRVQIALTNAPPIADAGADQIYTNQQGVTFVTLDGSRSSDPEHVALSYHWVQLSGWKVVLQDAGTAQPTFAVYWPGIYRFQLVVNDGLQHSQPSVVTIAIGVHQAPVAVAGPARYVSRESVTLDGSGSYEPDGFGSLNYRWSQVSGPPLSLTGVDTPTPVVSGFVPRNTNQTCVFRLVVDDGLLASQPSTVSVTVVRSYRTNTLFQVNPPFDSAKPTILAFGGGNCSDGGGMTFGGVWEQQANWITVNTYTGPYTAYADMLAVYLSSICPDYRQPIQTIGFSTGNLPAMDVAWYMNTTYADARYAINRVSLLDAVCSNPITSVKRFNANPIAGEQCWIDNYISNDPQYSSASVVPATINVVCLPSRYHGYPVDRYSSSSLQFTNGGLTAFAYLSVIGDGKHYQLNTASNKYYFKINAAEAIAQFNATNYPGKILAPVQLTGPADGEILSTNGVTLGCQPVENAVRYQLLWGFSPDRVMDYTVLSDSTNPPQQTITALPQEHTWWTVRAYDQFGSTIYADPRQIQLPPNHPPLADAGPSQVLIVGPDGLAAVTLDGSRSSDPDGNALSYLWAWVAGNAGRLTNGVSPTITLPVGVHTVQLTVNDGAVASPPATVQITVLGAQGVLSNVLAELIDLRHKPHAPHMGENLDEAIHWLQASLRPELWLDQTHIGRCAGDPVFRDHAKAVHALDMPDHLRPPRHMDRQWRDFIRRIVESDGLLAATAIHDAAAAGVNSNRLVTARCHLRMGDEAASKQRFEAAIVHYGNAWRESSRLMVRIAGRINSHGRLLVEFVSLPGEACVLETSTDLIHWSKAGLALTGVDGTGHFDTPQDRPARMRFYRVRTLP